MIKDIIIISILTFILAIICIYLLNYGGSINEIKS